MSNITKNIPKIVIGKNKNSLHTNWKEILEYKDLFYFLTLRDIKIRYKQTVLGILWIIIQPILSLITFTIVFGRFAKMPSDKIPYPIFVYIGQLFWNFFSSTLSGSAASLVSNENIIKKVYFPRIMAPISSIFSRFIDLIPTTAILIGMLIFYKVHIQLNIFILLPLMILLIVIFSLGVGMFLAPINAKYRDVRIALPFFIQLGFFITPVVYPTSLFGGTIKFIRILNPVAEAIEVSRSAFFGTRPTDWKILALSASFALATFFIGYFFFKKQEDKFIDIL